MRAQALDQTKTTSTDLGRMKKRYFIGIDVAKATFDFCLLARSGRSLWQGKLSNDECGIKQFLSQLQARGWRLQQSLFAREASGVYGQALVAALHPAAA
jgi:transposase